MGIAETVAAGTFALIFLLVLGPYWLLVVRSETGARDTLQQRIRTGAGAARSTGIGILKEVERLSSIDALNKALARSGMIAGDLGGLIRQSGLKVTAGQVVLGSGCLALLTYLLVVRSTGQFWMGLVAGPAAAMVPYVLLRWLRVRRLRTFEEHFPEAVDLIARTLRAGHAFSTGLRMAADELPEPVAGEFKLLHDQQSYGLPLTEALKDFAQRIPIIDARFFVTAVLTQREAGGNLAEVLDNLSAVIRERFRIKRQLRVITAHGRLSGMVLAILPPALAVYLALRIPEHFRLLIDDPLGVRMVIVAIVLQLLGAVLIHKITNVEY